MTLPTRRSDCARASLRRFASNANRSARRRSRRCATPAVSGLLAAQEPEPHAGVDQDGQPRSPAERRRATGRRSGCEPNASPSRRRRSALINSFRPSPPRRIWSCPDGSPSPPGPARRQGSWSSSYLQHSSASHATSCNDCSRFAATVADRYHGSSWHDRRVPA